MINKKTFEKQLTEGLDEAGMLEKMEFHMVKGDDMVHVSVNPAEFFTLYHIEITFHEATGEAKAVYLLDAPARDELKEAYDVLTKKVPRGFDYDRESGFFSKKYPCDKDGKWVQALLDDNNESFFYFRAVWAMLQYHDDSLQDGYDYVGRDW
jgi:hypothetical protein